MAVASTPSPTGIHDVMRGHAAAHAAAAPSKGTETAPASASRTGDSVSLSPLASALKGNALTVFNEALGDSDRKALDEAVRAGTLSGEDVAKGLETRLKRVGLAFGGDVKVAAVDLDGAAATRALGRPLAERGQHLPAATDTSDPDSPVAKASSSREGEAPPSGRLAYFTAIDEGGDAAARTMSDLGVDLGTFGSFASSILKMLDKGMFDFTG